MSAAEVIRLVAAVPDPELPFVTISDLGILRSVEVVGTHVRVCVTPTYSGCPATEAIAADIRSVLARHGYDDAEVETVLSPAWTTDWLSEQGRRALEEHGIAPPGRGPVFLELSAARVAGATGAADTSAVGAVVCPQCRSTDTEELTRFGSTACKALWRCLACREPFEHLKQH